VQGGSQMGWVSADCSTTLAKLKILAIKLVHFLGPVPHMYFQQLEYNIKVMNIQTFSKVLMTTGNGFILKVW
jgi:hypothetical protein